MFNPVLNKDGTLSKFRVFCLLVLAICIASYALLLWEDEPELASVQELSSVSQLSAVANSAAEQTLKSSEAVPSAAKDCRSPELE